MKQVQKEKKRSDILFGDHVEYSRSKDWLRLVTLSVMDRPRHSGFFAYSEISTLESGFAFRIRKTHVDGRKTRKAKVADLNYPDTCGRSLG